MTFEGSSVTLELEVSSDRSVQGQLVPPGPGTVEVRWRKGFMVVQADDLGRFSVAGLPSAPVSLRCDGLRDGRAVATDWIVV